MTPISTSGKLNRSPLAALVLFAGLVITALAAIFAFRAYDADESQRFNEAVSEIQSDLQFRLDFYVNSIRQLAAAFAINPKMTQEQFLDFTNSTGIRANDEGIFSYGVFRRWRGSHPRFTVDLRAIGSHPPSKTVPLGTEVSDANRIDLFNSAIDSAQAALNVKVPGMVNAQDSGPMLTVAAYEGIKIPEMVDERRRRAVGLAYARFSDSGLFGQVLVNASSYKSHLNVEIFSGGIKTAQAKPIYSRIVIPVTGSLRSSKFEITGAGHVFTVQIRATISPIWSVASLISILIAAVGVALSLILFRVLRERERRSERLFKSERQLKLMTESLPVLVSYIDTDYVYRFNNRVYEERFSKERNDITDRRVEDVLGPHRFKQLKPALDTALAGVKVERDWTISRDDGSIISYHQVLLPDLDHRGRVRGVVAMHTDITDRAKRQSRAVFLEEVSSILATSLDPVLVAQKLTSKMLSLCDWCVIELVDDEGRVDRHVWSANTPDRIARMGKYYEDYPPATSERRITARARTTKQTQFVPHVTRESVSSAIPDAGRLDALMKLGFESIVVTPLLSNDRVLGTLALYCGQKDKLYTQDDVQFFEEVALRSSLAIENARLYAQSQNLNRAKDHFLAMLSHELRTPMNVILGWLEILTTEDVDKETYTQALDTLNRNAKVQIQLINDLLDVSRIINGKLSLEATPSDLGEIAKFAMDSVQPAVRAKHIETALTKAGELGAAVDAERIQQVLWNLLSNAVKFTPQGGKITMAVTGNPDSIRIEVRDSGQGIEESFLPFVFDRFRQEEGGFTRSQGGLGLGLSIVRYIVEGHGGTISVASSGRGHGAAFTVVLPRVAQINEEAQLTP